MTTLSLFPPVFDSRLDVQDKMGMFETFQLFGEGEQIARST